MKKKYELIIFDLAGTLVDTGSIAPMIAFNRAFKEAGHDIPDEVIRKFMGTNKRDHIRLIFEDLELDFKDAIVETEKIYACFKRHISTAIEETSRPIKGIPQTLTRLQDLGYRLAVTTGYNKEQSLLVYNSTARTMHNQWWLPRPIICSNDVNKGRPYPYMCFKAMEYYGIDSGLILLILFLIQDKVCMVLIFHKVMVCL